MRSPLGITTLISNASQHLLAGKSDYIFCNRWHNYLSKPIAFQRPLITTSRLFLSRKYNRYRNNFIDTDGLVNESLLTDYSEANYSNDIFENAGNNTISELESRGYDKPLLSNAGHNHLDNTVSEKSHKVKNKRYKKTENKATSKVDKIKSNELIDDTNTSLQASTEPSIVENNQDKLTKTSIHNASQNNYSITENIVPHESLVVNHNLNNFQDDFSQHDLFNQDNTTENTELISEKQSNPFKSESSTFYNSDTSDADILINNETNEYISSIDNDHNISSSPGNKPLVSQENCKKPSNLDANIAKGNIQKQELVNLPTFNQLSETETENISPNIPNFITEKVSHPIDDSIRYQDNNIQEPVINSQEIPISDVTQPAEKPLGKIISDSNNQINLLQRDSNQEVAVNSKSQAAKQTTSEIPTNQPVSADNFIQPQTLNQLSETENVSENSVNALVANQPVNSPTTEDIFHRIDDSIRHEDDNIQGSVINSEEIPISDVTQLAEKLLEKITSDSNNQINLLQRDSNQEFSDNLKSPTVKQPPDKELTDPSLSNYKESEIKSATTYEQIGTTDLRFKQISDDSHQPENLTQEISQKNKDNLPIQTVSETSSNITDNHELTFIESDISTVLPQISPELSTNKQTDIQSSQTQQTQQTQHNFGQNNDSIQAKLNLDNKQEEIALPVESGLEINLEINTDISNHENLPEDLLESDSSTEIPIIDSDIQINTTTETNRRNISKFQLGEKSNVNHQKAPQGYATGGKVTESKAESNQEIASSDTVPAMLTPGEFVINAQDTQKNIDILEHINSGGTPEKIIQPSLEKSISPETENTSLQRKEPQVISSPASKLLTSSSLGLEIGKETLSLLNSPHINQVDNTNSTISTSPIKNYSSPNLIFRKQVTHNINETPNQWSSVEELLNSESEDFTTVFNLGTETANFPNSNFSHLSQNTSNSLRTAPKRIAGIKSFNQGGEVTTPQISRQIEPVSETIQNPSFSIEADSRENEEQDTEDLEVLANEIYLRLRQRLEIERERQGIYYGRLPW